MKKNKVVTVFLVFILLGGLLALSYYMYKQGLFGKDKARVIYNEPLKVEVNEECVISYFVKEVVNGTIVNSEDKVDTSSLGVLELELVIKNLQDEEEQIPFKINVVDTTKPEINAKKDITSYVGKEIDLLEGVTVSDNSKEEIKAKVIGEYDINKEGEYKLKYEAADSSGNKGEYDFILNIITDYNNRTFTTSKGFSAKVVDGVTYIDGVLVVNKTYSIPSSYGNGLTWETQNAFNEMNAAFANEKTDSNAALWISSGYRSYWDQKAIYNNYVSWDGQANADTYSARPGHSEHQTGLAFDLNSIDDSFTYTYEGKWVHDNCYRFGLILRYPLGKESITGYMHESWHLRYVGVELATKLYNDGDWITLEEYYGIDSKYS